MSLGTYLILTRYDSVSTRVSGHYEMLDFFFRVYFLTTSRKYDPNPKEKSDADFGGGGRGDRRYNGQNLNQVVMGCEPVITTSIKVCQQNGGK